MYKTIFKCELQHIKVQITMFVFVNCIATFKDLDI